MVDGIIVSACNKEKGDKNGKKKEMNKIVKTKTFSGMEYIKKLSSQSISSFMLIIDFDDKIIGDHKDLLYKITRIPSECNDSLKMKKYKTKSLLMWDNLICYNIKINNTKEYFRNALKDGVIKDYSLEIGSD